MLFHARNRPGMQVVEKGSYLNITIMPGFSPYCDCPHDFQHSAQSRRVVVSRSELKKGYMEWPVMATGVAT